MKLCSSYRDRRVIDRFSIVALYERRRWHRLARNLLERRRRPVAVAAHRQNRRNHWSYSSKLNKHFELFQFHHHHHLHHYLSNRSYRLSFLPAWMSKALQREANDDCVYDVNASSVVAIVADSLVRRMLSFYFLYAFDHYCVTTMLSFLSCFVIAAKCLENLLQIALLSSLLWESLWWEKK
jgi:hypothetical protein